MKTFKEFLEEAYLVEMRKEDKVKGEKETPLYVTKTSGRVEKTPEGKLEVRKSTRTSLSPRASTGRKLQGMIDPKTQPYATRMTGAARHAHGGGGYGAEAPGRLRGKKRVPGEKRAPEPGYRSPEQKLALRRAQQRRSMGGGR